MTVKDSLLTLFAKNYKLGSVSLLINLFEILTLLEYSCVFIVVEIALFNSRANSCNSRVILRTFSYNYCELLTLATKASYIQLT